MNFTAPEIAHGWTAADVDRIVRWALRMPHTQLGQDFDTRYEIATSAAFLALCEATTPPSIHHLRRAAWSALARQGEQELRHHGYRRDGSARWGFDAYWFGRVAQAPDPADIAADRDAARRALAVMSPMQRACIVALAECGTLPAAAHALGLATGTVKIHVFRARAKVRGTQDVERLFKAVGV